MEKVFKHPEDGTHFGQSGAKVLYQNGIIENATVRNLCKIALSYKTLYHLARNELKFRAQTMMTAWDSVMNSVSYILKLEQRIQNWHSMKHENRMLVSMSQKFLEVGVDMTHLNMNNLHEFDIAIQWGHGGSSWFYDSFASNIVPEVALIEWTDEQAAFLSYYYDINFHHEDETGIIRAGSAW